MKMLYDGQTIWVRVRRRVFVVSSGSKQFAYDPLVVIGGLRVNSEGMCSFIPTGIVLVISPLIALGAIASVETKGVFPGKEPVMFLVSNVSFWFLCF